MKASRDVLSRSRSGDGLGRYGEKEPNAYAGEARRRTRFMADGRGQDHHITMAVISFATLALSVYS